MHSELELERTYVLSDRFWAVTTYCITNCKGCSTGVTSRDFGAYLWPLLALTQKLTPFLITFAQPEEAVLLNAFSPPPLVPAIYWQLSISLMNTLHCGPHVDRVESAVAQ